MIKCHLSTLMGKNKIKISDLSRETGVHRNMLTLLYYEEAKRIDFDVIERLCCYFGCGVGELLELQTEKKQ